MFKSTKSLPALCLTALLALAGCSNGNGNPVSGHQVGINLSDQIADFGHVRVEFARVTSARNFPIPPTRYFSFSWSPAGHQNLFAKKGWRQPTKADWDRSLALRLESTDWSRHRRGEKDKKNVIKRHQRKKANHQKSGYKSRVRSDGVIMVPGCSGTVSGRPFCQDELSISKQARLRLAQQALDRFDPGCRLGRIDPPEMTKLHPNYKSSKLSMFIQVSC